MSHFSQIKTQIRSLPALQSALADLGMTGKPGPLPIKGYQGKTETVDLAVSLDQGCEFGFSWNGTEYGFVTDLELWQHQWTVEQFLGKVTQRYAYHAVLQSALAQGFELASEQNQEDGSLRLVVQRWRG